MKLPIGIQTFSQVRSDNYVYVDKTKEAYEMIDSYKYVFLSRPRRFGKSLFLDTLQNIFLGNKEYFKDLYIEDKWDFNNRYPVIHISFDGDLSSVEGLKSAFKKTLNYNQDNLDIKCDMKDMDSAGCLDTLIRKAFEKYNKRVVILVDEYDKPLLDNITNKSMSEFARDMLRGFYSVIKGNDQFIKFAFLTGVSKFSKVSLFSGLNNLEDITLNPKFGNICGYTHEDIKTTFKPLLKEVDLEELKSWYNGYNFLKDRVYNPFDILLFIRNDFVYKNYWFETGTPTFLLDLIKKNNYYLPELENIVLGEEILNSFDMDNIDLEVVLYQAGYLTIEETISNPLGGFLYSLKIPNKEVRQSLNGTILHMFISNPTRKVKMQTNVFKALFSANLDEFKLSLTSLFASLPYQNYVNNNIQIYEGFYASVIYTFISSLGFDVEVEESTNQGRLDMSILINNNRYVFEFKTDDSNALNQIKQMKYYEKYLSENSHIYLVGINFDTNEKNISSLEWERLFL